MESFIWCPSPVLRVLIGIPWSRHKLAKPHSITQLLRLGCFEISMMHLRDRRSLDCWILLSTATSHSWHAQRCACDTWSNASTKVPPVELMKLSQLPLPRFVSWGCCIEGLLKWYEMIAVKVGSLSYMSHCRTPWQVRSWRRSVKPLIPGECCWPSQEYHGLRMLKGS